MDEFEEGQLSSDVQNSSKDDLEDDIGEFSFKIFTLTYQ